MIDPEVIKLVCEAGIREKLICTVEVGNKGLYLGFTGYYIVLMTFIHTPNNTYVPNIIHLDKKDFEELVSLGNEVFSEKETKDNGES